MNSNTLKFSEIKISKLRKVKPTRKRQISRVSSYTTSNSFNSYSMSVQPLTSLLVVESKNSCPAGYECIGLTDTGQDADLWKDGWFSTVRRYLCYSRDPRHSEYNTLIVSVQMCAGQEGVPTDFEVIATTSDTQKPALKNNLRIVYRRLPLVQTSAVISDIAIYDQKSDLPNRWQCIAMINNMQIAVKQMSKRELENQNKQVQNSQSVGDNGSSTLNINNPQNLLQKSQFRTANTRSQKSYAENGSFSGHGSDATTVAHGSLPHSSYASTGPRMVNSQTSVKVGPIDGLEFTVSNKVQQETNSCRSFGDEDFVNHSSGELVDFDFGKEMEVLMN